MTTSIEMSKFMTCAFMHLHMPEPYSMYLTKQNANNSNVEIN